MTNSNDLIHGVAVGVAIDPDGPLVGALLLGASGAGKSALALALIENCRWARTALIADDAVYVSAFKGALWARAPARIKGLLEIRGFGPVPVRTTSKCALTAGFDLSRAPERLPEPPLRAISGQAVKLPVWPFLGTVDGAARVRLILRSILGGQTPWRAHDSDDSKTS